MEHDAGGELAAGSGAVSGGVERVGGLGVGVVVEEPVERGERVGVGLAGCPTRWRDGDGEAGGLPAAEADVEVDLVGLVEGDVVDDEPDHPFAFPLRGGGVGPQPGEVGGQRTDLGLLLVAEHGVGLPGPVVGVLGVAQGPKRVVPVGFEAVGDEPIVGIDRQVAPPGGLGTVTGAFDVGGAQPVGFGGASGEFGLDAQGDLERERGEGVQHERGDGGIDTGAGHALAARGAVLDRCGHALVVGMFHTAAGVVAHGHPLPAAAAHREALEQRRSFAWRTGGPVGAVRGGVAEEAGLVDLERLPGDVAGMGVADQRGPLLPRERLEAAGAIGAETFAASSVSERAGVAGVVQGAQHPPVLQRGPGQFALVRPGADPHREVQLLIGEDLHDHAGGAGRGEGVEQQPDGLLHAEVGVEHDLVGRVVDQPDGQGQFEFTAPGLGQLPAPQPCADEVQLGLLCGLARYADLGRKAAVQRRFRPQVFGIMVAGVGVVRLGSLIRMERRGLWRPNRHGRGSRARLHRTRKSFAASWSRRVTRC